MTPQTSFTILLLAFLGMAIFGIYLLASAKEPKEKNDSILDKQIREDLQKKINADKKGCPFDETVYNPKCKECGLMNTELCNTCFDPDKQAERRKFVKDALSKPVNVQR